jgi:hypothetical protein
MYAVFIDTDKYQMYAVFIDTDKYQITQLNLTASKQTGIYTNWYINKLVYNQIFS